MPKEKLAMSQIRQNQVIAAVLFIISFALLAGTAAHYGITYDEPVYLGLGQRHAQWFSDLWSSIRAGDIVTPFSAKVLDTAWYAGKDQQPPLVKVVSGLGQRWLTPILGEWAAMRLPSILLFAVAVTGLFLLCAPSWGRIAGLFAALSLLLMPRPFAHAHYAALDAPIAALSLLTIIAFLRLAEHDSFRWAAIAGVAFGLALLTKLNAFFLPIMVIAWALLCARHALPKAALALFVIGPAVFFIGWPWLWHSPLERLADYLAFHLRHYPVDVFYLGKMYHYAPWHYPWVLTAITTPTPVLLLSLFGLVNLAGARTPQQEQRQAIALLLAIGAGVSLLFSSLPFAPKYNGVRLFLPAFPFIAGLAGAGLGLVTGALRSGFARWQWGERAHLGRGLAAALAFVLLLPTLLGVTATHPHQLAYYNALVGGPLGARARGFETIYWGGVYLDALGDFNNFNYLHPGATLYITPPGAISLLVFYQRAGMLRPDLRFVSTGATRPETLRAIAAARLVVFQCAQSEFDEVSSPLYRFGHPQMSRALGPGKLAVPLVVGYASESAVMVLKRVPRGSAEVSH